MNLPAGGGVGTGSPTGGASLRRPGQTFELLTAILAQRSGRWGVVIVVFHLGIALISPYLAPHDFAQQQVTAIMQPPSPEHWFGTDKLGRDVFSRTLLGGREAILISSLACAIAMLWGGLLGTFLALAGGRIDEWCMRLVDALLALPWILVVMIFIAAMGNDAGVLILVLGVTYGFSVVRVARSAALDFVAKDFILAAQARGQTRLDIVWNELMPNVRDSLAVETAMQWSWMLLGFCSLSFLGMGVSPPTPDWGLMISDARGTMAAAPWSIIAPMIALSSLVIGVNLIADAVSKALGVDRTLGRAS
jgi:peptide/nickel transport system permease protein